jgi:hypothetical protein
MAKEDELWEHKQPTEVVDALMTRLLDGAVTEGYEQSLLQPFTSSVTTDFENHPRTDDDPHYDERIERIITESPELFDQFKRFVEGAFLAGPRGDGKPEHFAVLTNQAWFRPD